MIKAVVQRIKFGRHGPYFEATSKDFLLGILTCSLNPPVWREKCDQTGVVPIGLKEGVSVALDDFTENNTPQGMRWRANYGRFWRPSDVQITQDQTNTEQPRKED